MKLNVYLFGIICILFIIVAGYAGSSFNDDGDSGSDFSKLNKTVCLKVCTVER